MALRSSSFVFLIAAAGVVSSPGCAFFQALAGNGSASNGQGGGIAQGPSAEDQALEEAAKRRSAAEAAPGDAAAAQEYAVYVHALASQGVYERAGIEAKPRVDEAIVFLEAVEAEPTQMAISKSYVGALHELMGDEDAALSAYEAAYGIEPWSSSWDALIAWHGKHGDDARVVEICKELRGDEEYGDKLYILFDQCLRARAATSIEAGLDFASKGDRAWFESEMRRIEAEQQALAAQEAQRRAEEEAQRERERAAQAEAAAASSSSSSSSSASNGPVYVNIRNRCRETVKVFYGDKPKFGSGTYSSMSSNSSTSHSFRPGDMMWIVDDSQNGLGSVTVSPGMREIEILDSCTGMTAR